MGRVRPFLFDILFYQIIRKFDLEGIGSISTQQLIDQLKLTSEGKPKDATSRQIKKTYPDSFRSKFEDYKGPKLSLVRNFSCFIFVLA